MIMTRTSEEIARLPYRKNVGVMLVNSDDRVFVGRRIDMKGPHWQMPQGGIDPGESPEEAALRELEAVSYTHLTLPTTPYV